MKKTSVKATAAARMNIPMHYRLQYQRRETVIRGGVESETFTMSLSEGIILWANQTELDVLQYTAEEYIGQPVMNFCPDEKDLVLEIFKTLGSGNIIKDVPVRFRRKDGGARRPLLHPSTCYTVQELNLFDPRLHR